MIPEHSHPSPDRDGFGAETPPSDVLQLCLTLADVQPRVWRRVLVPRDATLHQLHDVLQVTFGWSDDHHHVFEVNDVDYGSPDDDRFAYVLDERGVSLGDVAASTAQITYLYDFVDQWRVAIAIEAAATTLSATSITCLEGENAGPPEQFGGLALYSKFVAVARDDEVAVDQYRDVLGRPLDPTRFDLEMVNEVLAALS